MIDRASNGASDGKPEPDARAVAKDLLRRRRWVLVVASIQEPARIVDVAGRTGIPQSTVSRILRVLERNGLAARRSGIDRRGAYYVLTNRGNQALKIILNILRSKLRRCVWDQETRLLDEECMRKALLKIAGDPEKLKILLDIIGIKNENGYFYLKDAF